MGNVANLRPFPPGVSGNPGGKPAGARNRLQADFMNAFAEDFAAHGKGVIERVRTKFPVAYIRAAVNLMPRQLESAGMLDDMDDAEMSMLVAMFKAARKQRMSQQGDTPDPAV